MFCKACGNEVVATAVICPKCGSSVSNEQVVPMSKGLLIAGWIGSVLFPILGVIVGIIAIVKKNYPMGIGMLIVSCFMWMVWAAMWM